MATKTKSIDIDKATKAELIAYISRVDEAPLRASSMRVGELRDLARSFQQGEKMRASFLPAPEWAGVKRVKAGDLIFQGVAQRRPGPGEMEEVLSITQTSGGIKTLKLKSPSGATETIKLGNASKVWLLSVGGIEQVKPEPEAEPEAPTRIASWHDAEAEEHACGTCGVVKPASNFQISQWWDDGSHSRRGECRSCVKAR